MVFHTIPNTMKDASPKYKNYLLFLLMVILGERDNHHTVAAIRPTGDRNAHDRIKRRKGGTTPLAAILGGANMNFSQLRYVAERTDLGEQTEALFGVTIPERPGSFLAFCTALGRRRISEFNYRYASPDQAHVFVGVGLERGHEEAEELHRHLVAQGYEVVDLSGDEVAKLHVRYMVGGPGPGIRDELLYRFEFPERPGALRDFLEALAHGWNISLFHYRNHGYRNHGADYGRVLVGIQVPRDDRGRFERALSVLGYPHWPETGNSAYRMFLGGTVELQRRDVK